MKKAIFGSAILKRSMKSAIFLSALAAFWTANSQSAPPSIEDLGLEDLVKTDITSVSRKSQSLADVAAAAFVISSEDIRRSGAQALPDVLRMAPGIEVAQIDSGRYAVSARGFNGRFANKLQVLVDGRSIYHPLFSGVMWELDPVPLDDIERIEIIRGAGAVMWGANAVNGVINIITRHSRSQAGGALNVGAGTQGAGNVYARLGRARETVRRVVLLGPSHHVAFRGLAASRAEFFETPLGRIAVDTRALAELADLPQVQVLDAAHAREHSLEVHLPFLQVALRDFQLVPLVVGDATAAEVAQVLERLWGGPETLIVVSSDLSHYHDYATARRLDRETSRFIQDLSPVPLHGEQACGCRPVSGLLQAARDHGLQARLLDLRSSGDTAGPRDRVVGYGAYAFA